MSLKPIHKFNGGRGATICHKCRVIISDSLTDDLYCEKHGGNPEFNYKLVRHGDGLTKYAENITWVLWNEDGTFHKKSEDIVVGASLVLDFFAGSYQWMTTSVKSYTKESPVIIFQTKNSTYTLEKCNK